MTAQPLRLLRSLCLGIVLANGLWAQNASSDEASPAKLSIDIDTLLDAFGKMPGLEARFVEEKHISLLQAPLVSHGRLYFTRPGYLLRRIESPQTSQVLITPNSLALSDGNDSNTIDLRAQPQVRMLVGSFVALLAGDKAALASDYHLELTPDPKANDEWRLSLVPKSAPLSELIAKVQVRGKGLFVSEVRVIEKAGDETITRMREVNPARQFSASERKALFGMSAS